MSYSELRTFQSYVHLISQGVRNSEVLLYFIVQCPATCDSQSTWRSDNNFVDSIIQWIWFKYFFIHIHLVQIHVIGYNICKLFSKLA